MIIDLLDTRGKRWLLKLKFRDHKWMKINYNNGGEGKKILITRISVHIHSFLPTSRAKFWDFFGNMLQIGQTHQKQAFVHGGWGFSFGKPLPWSKRHLYLDIEWERKSFWVEHCNCHSALSSGSSIPNRDSWASPIQIRDLVTWKLCKLLQHT